MRRVVDLAKKLEVTSLVLGCLTRKELCAAFARINPNTVMTLQNSYNWQSGRAAPRSFSLFEDWAAVLRLDQGPHFVMSSSLKEFVQALDGKVVLPDGLLQTLGEASAPPATPASGATPAEPAPARTETGGAWQSRALLEGSFLALSLAWSPAQRGRLLAGALSLEVESTRRLSAIYLENVLGRVITFAGEGAEDGQTAQLRLQCEANATSFLMALHLPLVPGNLGGGIFAGHAVYDPDSEPTAGAILLLRNHDLSDEELASATGYRDLGEAALADYLQRLGYGRDPDARAERDLMRLLTTEAAAPLVSMRRAALVEAAFLVDRRRLRATGHA